MKRLLFAAFALLLLAGGAWWYLGSGSTEPIRILATAKVERGDVRRLLEATGIVESQVGATVNIGSRSTGQLSEVLVRVGDTVQAGQVVARIDDRELRAQRAQAVANLNLARAEYEYQKTNLARLEQLVSQSLESQSSLDEARRAAQVARYEVEADRAAINRLDVEISYTVITTPISGVVSQIAAQEGEMIVAGLQVTNLITVLDPSRLEMWIYVDETDIGQVAPGLQVEYTVDAYPGRTFQGVVDRVYPEPQTIDNIVYYSALVPVSAEDANFLRPSMTTQCRIIVQTASDVPTIPNTALKWVDGEQVVFVPLPDGGVDRVRPELGLAGLERSEVVSGLDVGQEVATQLVLPGTGGGGGD